jgi:hypothetical protein
VKRKGYRREARSEGSVDQMCESMNNQRMQGASVGRAGNLPRSPYPSKMRSVDPTIAHGRRLRLPQEICPVSLTRGEEAWSGLSRISRTVVLRSWSGD